MFCGVYVPWEEHDVYAANGVSGPGANALSVNFGGRRFVLEEANEDGHVGYFAQNEDAGAPPGYSR